MTPLFSIITVTRNAAPALSRTLESVAAQTCGLYELIIQDGASTDGTLAMVEQARARGLTSLLVDSRPDSGIYEAMNRAMARASGEYLLFLNAGDALHAPDTLQTLADAAFEHDFPGIIYGYTDIIDSQGSRIGPRHLAPPETLTFDSFRQGMTVCHQAMVVLRKLTEPYDLRYRYSADYDWVIRLLKRSRRNLRVDTVVADYLNQGATTQHHLASLTERYRIMCHHYGALGSTLRHFGFAARALRRKLSRQ